MTTLLFIGDIVGRPGRELVRRAIPVLVSHHQVDLVIANVENAAAGFGVTPDIADDFISWGVQVMTGGATTRDKKERSGISRTSPACCARQHARRHARRGAFVARATNGVPVAVINAIGRVLMTAIDDPFRVVMDGSRPSRTERN